MSLSDDAELFYAYKKALVLLKDFNDFMEMAFGEDEDVPISSEMTEDLKARSAEIVKEDYVRYCTN